MKKIIAVIIALLVCISAIPSYAAPDPYWALQAAYNEAMKTETIDDDIPACEGIISYYEKLDSETACRRVISPLLKVVKIYESTGQFDKALRCYKLYKTAYEYLDKHTSDDCTEALKFADSFIRQYSFVTPMVYTAAYSPADVKYYGAKNEHKVGTYSGMCGYYDSKITNGKILYVQFETETIYSFDYSLPKTSDKYMLEVAWNTSDHSIENFKNIADGKHDEYIIENLKYLDSLENCIVMLRFGAEVNEWEANTTYAKNGKLEEFKKAYINAFRRVSDLAQKYSPDVAMVYSPNDISNMHVTATDFYPGDNYVDWIGMSSYMNKSSNATNEWSSMTDAYYSRGVYANQLMKIKDIVDAFGDKKPIMISESGFCYSSTNSTQTLEHAKDKMQFFLSYVNMVFPQVKAVFYFNTNMNGNSYQLFDSEGNSVSTLSKTYLDCMNSNIPIKSLHEDKPQGYTRLTTINEVRDNLYLAVFASYPGNPKLKVKYTWDGKDIDTVEISPYSTVLNKDKLTQGDHILKVTTNCLNTTYEQYYTVKVDNGIITAKEKIDETITENNTTTKLEQPQEAETPTEVKPIEPEQIPTEVEPVEPEEIPAEVEPVEPEEAPTEVEPVEPEEAPTEVETVEPEEIPTEVEPIEPEEAPTEVETVEPEEARSEAEPEEIEIASPPILNEGEDTTFVNPDKSTSSAGERSRFERFMMYFNDMTAEEKRSIFIPFGIAGVLVILAIVLLKKL